MKYVASSGIGKPIELADINGTLLGSVRRASWFSIKSALLSVGSAEYRATPKGFFQMEVAITLGDALVCSVQFGLVGKISITPAGGAGYLFKRTNIWRGYYTLYSQTDHPIVVIEPRYDWSSFGYRYNIETDDNYAEGRDVLLLAVLLYAVNAMQRTRAAAA